MQLILTDILTCPRCGPEFGLIVLADEVADRDVLAGRLGCTNCRESFEIRGGVARLRAGNDAPTDPNAAVADAERAYRAAALLGVGHAPGPVLVIGGGEDLATEMGRHLPKALVAGGESLEFGPGVPARSHSLRGLAVLDRAMPDAREVARVLAPGARVVVDPAPPEVAHSLADAGLEVLLEQEGVVVASA